MGQMRCDGHPINPKAALDVASGSGVHELLHVYLFDSVLRKSTKGLISNIHVHMVQVELW